MCVGNCIAYSNSESWDTPRLTTRKRCTATIMDKHVLGQIWTFGTFAHMRIQLHLSNLSSCPTYNAALKTSNCNFLLIFNIACMGNSNAFLNLVAKIIHCISSTSQGLLSTTVLSGTHCEMNLAFSSKFWNVSKTSHTKQSTFEYPEQRR